jgi:hypothetical protein
MALDVTAVNRNLHTRVTFMGLEFEDLFVVLGLAALMNIMSRFVGGSTGAILQYGVPVAVVPLLIAFKYGKPRGYLRDLLTWHTKPLACCALARDKEIRINYVMDDTGEEQ